MSHPYRDLPDHQYWRRAISSHTWDEIDPVIETRIKLQQTTRVATAGSCFAQRIAASLMDQGYSYLKTETAPAGQEENPLYGQFSAAYGNVYTVLQLHQLMGRAYGMFKPKTNYWVNSQGRYMDPFRPAVREEGFETLEELLELQKSHLKAVRRVFEECEVFLFTFGLTEGWVAKEDRAAIPVVPGAVDCPDWNDHYEFHNARVHEMNQLLNAFLKDLRLVNPRVEVILTVSPVSMIATYEKQHVLLSNTYTKSALRVVAEETARDHDFVSYFPSFEMVYSHPSQAQYYEDDFRLVKSEGVTRVMTMFAKHYLSNSTVEERRPEKTAAPVNDQLAEETKQEYANVAGVLCDEERLAF
ncbi:GSCFA domain-containing protein [Phyllobacterium sp. 628]|uniref:GSCFA domain-containing protein n=1 Tax=Phyllobacterium sp. 628 TaxID=2718938 RepID=UPI0016625F9B|nr:GSCFA domain-containing protein [Phyllobacterium sp. 628]QND53036.1 GSCFA domain-containing protein [Phyllobacterium sp. 628]